MGELIHTHIYNTYTYTQYIYIYLYIYSNIVHLVAQMAKNLLALWETHVQSLGPEDPLEKEMATHSSILLAWEIQWTEEPGGLQSMGSQSGKRLSH